MLLLVFSFFSTMPRDWLGRTSPKWPILCWVGCKTLTQSISEAQKHFVGDLSEHGAMPEKAG